MLCFGFFCTRKTWLIFLRWYLERMQVICLCVYVCAYIYTLCILTWPNTESTIGVRLVFTFPRCCFVSATTSTSSSSSSSPVLSCGLDRLCLHLPLDLDVLLKASVFSSCFFCFSTVFLMAAWTYRHQENGIISCSIVKAWGMHTLDPCSYIWSFLKQLILQ